MRKPRWPQARQPQLGLQRQRFLYPVKRRTDHRDQAHDETAPAFQGNHLGLGVRIVVESDLTQELPEFSSDDDKDLLDTGGVTEGGPAKNAASFFDRIEAGSTGS